MRKNSLVKRAAITLMAAVMLTGAFMVAKPATDVYASSHIGICEDAGTISMHDIDADATVTSEYANVREGISTNYRVINTMDKGTTFHVEANVYKDGKATKWYRITTTDQKTGEETEGYISNKTFTFSDDDDMDSIESGVRMTVSGTKNYLALRKEASNDESKEIAELHNGDEVVLLKDCGKYSLVYSDDVELTGYVKSAYLA